MTLEAVSLDGFLYVIAALTFTTSTSTMGQVSSIPGKYPSWHGQWSHHMLPTQIRAVWDGEAAVLLQAIAGRTA